MSVTISAKMTYFVAERGRQITLDTVIVESSDVNDEDFCERYLSAIRNENKHIDPHNIWVEARVRKTFF